MTKTYAYAAMAAGHPLEPFTLERRALRPDDVQIDIAYCGICHSDIHTVRDEWGPAHYPVVPGHEIVGKVVAVGKKVKRFAIGDHVGVGCFVDACGQCAACKTHEQQLCAHASYTYNDTEKDGKTKTYGGYSTSIVVRESYVLQLKKSMPLERVAPLLCAGITTYSPLKRYGVKKGKKVGVVGLGGLGHMAVKLAHAMGAEVYVMSTSIGKKKDALRLGAKQFVLTSDKKQMDRLAGMLDVTIDTVSAPHELTPYLAALTTGGVHVFVGASPVPHPLPAGALIFGRKIITGSLIGGIKETQEMLDFCAKKKIWADVEVISAHQINEAYERTVQGKVKYRFVIDTRSLRA